MNISQSQIKSIVKIALKAGEIAMSYFGGNDLKISKKSDNTTLTIADSLISAFITQGLKNITPEIPIICEEGKNREFGNGTFWLIDPIDGTSSFATGDPEFTINIGLIKNKKPIFGLIFAPAIEGLPFYYTNENGKLMRYFVKEKKSEIFIAKKRNEKNFVVIASKRSSDKDILEYFTLHSHQENKFGWNNAKIKSDSHLHGNGKEECWNNKGECGNGQLKISKVSSSLKFIYLIENKADWYLHLRKSMEWDIAAGQALLEAIGGKIINLDGSEFLYEKAGLENQPFLANLIHIET